MPDYKNGKIYAIKSKETDKIYIGSTCSSLKNRMCSHKSNWKKINGGGIVRTGTSCEILKYSDAFIELIEEFPCNSKKELLDREGEIIKNTPNCVNTQIQGRTMAQYREDNKEKLKQYSVDYYYKNKEMLINKYKEWYNSEKGVEYRQRHNEKRKEKVICSICGCTVAKSGLYKHKKSFKCVPTGEITESTITCIEDKIEFAKKSNEKRKEYYKEKFDEVNEKRREKYKTDEQFRQKQLDVAKLYRETHNERITCPVCGKESVLKRKLFDHKKTKACLAFKSAEQDQKIDE